MIVHEQLYFSCMIDGVDDTNSFIVMDQYLFIPSAQ